MIRLYVDVSFSSYLKTACWGGVLYGAGDKPHVFGGKLKYIDDVSFLDVAAVDKAIKKTKGVLRRRGHNPRSIPCFVYNDNQTAVYKMRAKRYREYVSYTWLSREAPRMVEADRAAAMHREVLKYGAPEDA